MIEYISLSNGDSKHIIITGWKLQNGKGQRAYNVGSSLQYFLRRQSLSHKVPISFLQTEQTICKTLCSNRMNQLIITTGQMGINIPYKIVSFKENICTGYIEKLDNYSFTPHFKQIVFNLATSLG